MADPIDPALALAWFFAIALLGTALCWPRGGLVWRIRRWRRSSIRIQEEDTLKQLLRSERAGRGASVDALAGAIGISRAAATSALQRLAEQGEVSLEGEGPELTTQGRTEALRILRTHRLWERYLADRTGVRPERWHDDAEEAEHDLSPGQVEALSSRLGHPLYDPHGDPIPRLDGSLPPPSGTPLSRARKGDSLEVTHVEDEPPEVFGDLTRMGMAPHVRMVVTEAGPREVRVRISGEERSIPLVAAASVTVRPLEEGESIPDTSRTLADAHMGETVRVAGIAPVCQGPQRRRLLDLGIVRGTEVTPELVSSGGNPVAYRIRGALIALRSSQAEWIRVEPTDAAEAAEDEARSAPVARGA